MKHIQKSILVIFLFSMISCAPKIYPTKYEVGKSLATDETLSTLNKGNVSITVNHLDPLECFKPMYSHDVTFSYNFANTVSTQTLKLIFSIYEDLSVYEVNIVNNTNHIIRMKDSRIYLLEESKNEPVFAIEKNDMIENSSDLKTYTNNIKSITGKYPMSGVQKMELEKNVSNALNKTIKNLSFITGQEKEILPGMKLKGYLIFNVNPNLASEGVLSFIDIVTEVDQVGNPIKKERFDFNVKLQESYYKAAYDAQNKKYFPWQKITFEEFQQQPPK